MFCKGDKVVYPMYGAGVIEDLEEREIDGENLEYYVMRIPVGDLKIMVSVMKADKLGIRQVSSSDEVFNIIRSISNRPVSMAENWNQRYKENMDKIRTGQLSEVSEVFRNLLLREKERGLSSAEKKMLTNAKQIILSEIILSYSITRSEAEDLLTETVEGCFMQLAE